MECTSHDGVIRRQLWPSDRREATDFVILVMNDGGAKSLLKSKVKLGADASVAAGPVGRTSEASTNERMQAQMALSVDQATQF